MTTPTETKVDPRSLSTAALEAKRKHAATEAQKILDDYRARAKADNPDGGGDPYAIMGDDVWQLYKGHMQDLDHIEGEMGRRAELDQGEARVKAALGGGNPYNAQSQVASMLGMQVASGPFAKTLGELFAESDVYARYFEKTGGFQLDEEKWQFAFSLDPKTQKFSVSRNTKGGQKALVYGGAAVGGPLITPFYDQTPEMASRPKPDIIDLVSRVGVTTDTIYWSNQTARSTAATGVSEATNSTGTSGTKPEATITFERKSAPVEIIAVTAAVTEKELADAGQIAAIINEDLMDDLRIQLGSQLLTGSGSTPILTGILNAGIQTVANSTAIGNVLDSMLRAQTVIATANEVGPDAYVLEPTDWESMRILKSTGDGNYFGGSPFSPASPNLWNLPVIVNNQLTTGTGLVGAFKRACRLYEREGITIRAGWINDDFTRNVMRIRAEFRAGFVVRRPSAVARVTGV